MEQETKVCRRCGRELSIDNFKLTRYGTRVGICTECANTKMHDNRVRKQQHDEMEKARENAEKNERQKVLEQYTPRELIEELARRGYKGKLQYTQVHVIDIENF